MSDTKEIFKYWPFKNSDPRKTQVEVMEWISQLPSHIKYILCEIPVGGGKSPLAINYSQWLGNGVGNSYILTPQKVLQKQYENSFDEKIIHSLYGKANYTCESKRTNCEIGSEIKPKCLTCPHRTALEKVKYSQNVVMNYTLALLLFKYARDNESITKRKLIVCDEAHKLESTLVDFNMVTISEFRCKQIGSIQFRKFNNINQAANWVKSDYMPALTRKIKSLNSYVSELIEKIKNEDIIPSRDDIQIINNLKELVSHKELIIEQLVERSEDYITEELVLVNEGNTSFKFKELYGKNNFKQIMEPMADKFLFLSSTILDKNEFCSDLGLNPSETAFISTESEFELDNRPIFFIPTMKMNYGWDSEDRSRERKRMINKIINICNKIHPEESGVIHTGSFQIAEWLVDNLSHSVNHVIMHHNNGSSKSRDQVLEEFQANDGVPKLLISPSVTEGLDLYGDKGRFVIFAKVPFPNLSDAWVKKRMQISNDWYTRQALIAMIQGGGRVVRSHDDWGHVYILDDSFSMLLNRSKKYIPKWWTDSIKVLGD